MKERAAALLPGCAEIIVIRARRKWNRTGILVASGQRYELTAAGVWFDFYIRSGPRGYTSGDAPRFARGFLRRYEADRRMPHEPWFCLVGCVGEEGEPFVIGSGRDPWVVPEGRSGRLLCYANDVPTAYWNNWGSVRLRIRRLDDKD